MSDITAGPQLVPHSREAEEGVIGAVLINPDALYYDVAFLRSEDFYIHRNGWVWEAFIRLHSQKIPIDYITVTEELDKMGHLADIGGAAYLTKLMNNVPSSLHAEAYGRTVETTAIRRRMIANANQEAKDAYSEDKDINESIAEATTRLSKLVKVKESATTMKDVAVNVLDTILDRINRRAKGEDINLGFKTGIGYIDRNLLGLKKKWLVMFAGKPKVGKSRVVAQIANVLAEQEPGIYVSLEMDEESLTYRLLSTATKVSATDIEIGNVDATAVIKAVEDLNSDLGLWCTSGLTDIALQAFLAKQKLNQNIGWAIIDYVDLMIPAEKKRNETEEDKDLWNSLKRIAQELDILVIGIESVNKLAADGVMTDDKVVGSYGKIHAVDVAFGYSPYHAIPHKGCPELEDEDRKRRCRVLNVMADRHRETGGIVMPLEMRKNVINDFVKKEDQETEDEGGNWWDN